MGNNDPVAGKNKKLMYVLLSTFIVIGVVAMVLWQHFFLMPPMEEIQEQRVPTINVEFLTGDYLGQLDYFEIIEFPEDDVIGRSNPFSPWTIEEDDEENEEEVNEN